MTARRCSTARAKTTVQDALSSPSVARTPRRGRCRARSTKARVTWRERSRSLGKAGRLVLLCHIFLRRAGPAIGALQHGGDLGAEIPRGHTYSEIEGPFHEGKHLQ